MKSLLALACLLATTSIAAAQPSLTAPASAPAPAPDQTQTQGYVAAGATYGFVHGIYMAGTLEGGRRIHDSSWWFHTELIGGNEYGIDEPTYDHSGIQEARVGIETRGCALPVACIVVGADLAVVHEHYMAEYDSANGTTVLPVGHLALDIGGKHVRLRPGIEAGYHTFALDGALAVQW